MPGEPFFAVDVGATWIKSGLVRDGNAGEIAREPVVRSLDGLVAQVARLVEEASAPSWGLCIAGLVEVDTGTLRYSANLGLRDAPLGELLRPDVFVNDLDAAALGEAQSGTLALLQIGTGIAARHVIEGRVIPGGEVGHLRFRADGPRCGCGNRGCVEAYLPETEGVDDDALEAIGFAAAALVATWDPGTLRLGGGVAAAWGAVLVDAVREAVTERVLPGTAVEVEPARLGDAAALVGLARSAT